MSVKFFVECNGTRQSVTTTPMAPLSTVLDNYCLQSKDKLEVASCELYHQKKKLDLTTPVRFANLPKDAKLELVTGQQQQRLGLSERPKPQAQVQRNSSSADAETSIPQQQPPAGGLQQAQSPQPEQPADPQSVAGPSFPDTRPAASQQNQQATMTEPPSTWQHSQISGQTSGSSDALPAGLDRQVFVFKREAILAPGSSARSGTDLPAEFYDFTADDYHAVMSGWAKQKASAAGPLKTQKLREQDQRRRAEQFGPVPVRVHWPDGVILQAHFRALETLEALLRLVQQCAATDLPKWYLYVTPPKQALKDMGQNFYQAGLVPAANVHVGMDSQHSGPFLKQHVAALEGLPPSRPGAAKDTDTVAADQKISGIAGAQEFLPSSKVTVSGGEKKVPKWMKLNK